MIQRSAEHFPPAPRQVSEDPLRAAAERPKRIFIGVAAATALLYILMLLWGSQTLRTLHTVQGRAVRAWIAPGMKGSLYMLEFEFFADGESRVGSEAVTRAMYNQLVGPDGKVVPGPVKVYVSHVGAIYTARVTRNETPQLMWVAGILCVACLPWIPYAIWYLWLRPAQRRRICSTGTAVACTVTEQRERRRHGQLIYDLAYEFTAGSRRVHGKYSTNPGAWAAVLVPEICRTVRIGDGLTAIYSPKNPKRHLVYELSGLIVKPDLGGPP
jgi:hemin uptake protein HemP